MKKSNPEDVRARRVLALRASIATLTDILAEIEPSAELAARPAPAADASLEARAQAALAAFNACPVWRDNSLTGNEQEQRAMVDVVRAVDASRPHFVDGELVPIAQAVGKLQETIADAVMLSVEIDHLVRAAGGPWALHADKPKAEADVNAIDRLANIGRTASFAPDGGVDPWEEIDEDAREEWRVIARAIAADISNSVRSDLDRARQQLADLVPADGPLDALKAANAIDELLANVTRKLLPLAT